MDTKTVALYIRTSTDKQENSPKIQEETMIKYCNAYGYQIYDKYVDFGYSGSNTDRPAFNSMMEDAKNKKFNLVLVIKIDRFARSTLDLLINIKKLKEYDIDFAATEQPIDTSSAMGVMLMQIMGIFAEFDRAMITERMETGRKAAIERGVICNRPKKIIDTKQISNYVEMGLSANAIAKIFKVHPSTITDRLVNDCGYIYENKKWIKKEKSIQHQLEQLKAMKNE